jgi:hypothetical protein
MTEFEAQVLADLSVLKTQMKDLVGNGQPGRVAQIEARIFEHERAVQRLKGMAAAFAAMLTIAHAGIDIFLGGRR